MTGSDIAFWLNGILDDLLNLDTADVPLLVFKLVVLFGAAFFGWQLDKMVLKAVWSVLEPLLRLLWRHRVGAGAAAVAGRQTAVPAGRAVAACPAAAAA